VIDFRELDDLKPGIIVGLKPDFTDFLDRFRPRYRYDSVDVRVLQNGSATRALIIPIDSGASQALSPGKYRLTFTMDRSRWQTTEPSNDLNFYHKTTTLFIRL